MTTTTDFNLNDWTEALVSVMDRLNKPDFMKLDDDDRMHEAEYVVNYVKDLTDWSLKRITKNPDKAITRYLKSNK